MKREPRGLRLLRTGFIVAGLLLPALSLIPLGSLWLWQHGLLVYWALAACLTTMIAFAFQAWLLRSPPARVIPAGDKGPLGEGEAPDPIWTPREDAAWKDVLAVADSVNPRDLTSRDGLLALAQKTIDVVARRIHPEVADPLWQFTVPEALALTERVSARLGPMIAQSVPLGDQLTVAHMLRLYRWRGAIDVAEKAYDFWRLVRIFNPLSAATHEVREQISKKIYEFGRDELGRGLAKAYVREVGRAAIDLYGGRLRVSAADVEAHLSKRSESGLDAVAARAREPMRVLVVGQTGVGKSSVVNALLNAIEAPVDVLPATDEFVAYRLDHEGLPAALLIDTPRFKVKGKTLARMIDEAEQADLLLWVVSAARADRAADVEAMTAFRARYAERLDRHRPPVIVVLTSIDALRPFREWSPPYDLRDESNAKAASIRAAMAAVAADLGVDAAHIVPVSVRPGAQYNIDALWAKIMEFAPEVQRSRLIRTIADAKQGWDWRRILKQAGGAGRVVVQSLRGATGLPGDDASALIKEPEPPHR